jgi:hypothetical protein
VAEAKEQGPDTDSIWELELEHRQPQDAIEISASAVSVGKLATSWCPNTFIVRNSLGSKILGTWQSVPMQNRSAYPIHRLKAAPLHSSKWTMHPIRMLKA